MRNRMLMALLTVSMSAVMICGCKNKTDMEISYSLQDADTEKQSTTAASETESVTVTEETTDVKVTSWVEENGITFTEGELSIPVFTYSKDITEGSDNYGNIFTEDMVNVIQYDGVYSEPVIEVSEPDEDGNVTYTINYTITSLWKAYFSPYSFSFSRSVRSYFYGLMDAYTGMKYPFENNSTEYSISGEVVIDGTTYQAQIESSRTTEGSSIQWTDFGDYYQDIYYMDIGESELVIYCTMNVTVPAEYDGLMLFIDGNGKTEYTDLATELVDAGQLDMGNTEVNYIFKNINYEGKLLK